MSAVQMKDLLEAGVHFGHQTKRWNPKMRPYIFCARNGIYVIDLQKTVALAQQAYDYMEDLVAKGELIMFVGTKKQAASVVKDEAEKVKMPYVNNRWLGGTLTNFMTIKSSISRLKKYEDMATNGSYAGMTKKEIIKIEKEKAKLDAVLCGIKNMKKLPAALFVVDPQKERIAVAEANKLGIPVLALVDTNCDPDPVDYVIPGNDDAIKSISIFAKMVSEACVNGKVKFEDTLRKGGSDRKPSAEKKAEVKEEKQEEAKAPEKTEAKAVEESK